MSGQFLEQEEKINEFTKRLNKRQISKVKIDRLKKIIIILEENIKKECETCSVFKNKIQKLFDVLEKYSVDENTCLKQYYEILNEIVKHLKKEHGIIEEGTYIAWGLALGLIFGSVFTFGASESLGIAIGVAIGVGLEDDAKKNNKII